MASRFGGSYDVKPNHDFTETKKRQIAESIFTPPGPLFPGIRPFEGLMSYLKRMEEKRTGGRVMSDKTWRPENPYTKMLPATITYERDRKLTAEERIFEEGVDAMSEAMFKLAEESPTGTFTIDSSVGNILTTSSKK